MITIPKLSSDGLRHVFACCFIEFDDQPQLRDWFESNAGSFYSKTQEHGEDIYVRTLIGAPDEDGHGHIHLEAAVGEVFESPPTVTHALEETLGAMAGLEGTEFLFRIFGRFHLPLDSPVAGALRAMLGVTANLPSYKLTLTGCSFDVEGDGPLYKIRWTALEEDILSVELNLFSEAEVNDDLLADASAMLRTALRSVRQGKVSKKGNTDDE
jgi:hypothetical protein